MKTETTTIVQFNVDLLKSEDAESRRIGGFATTESLDKQGEILLQKGLDFSDLIKSGWFNDNHKQGMEHVVGYPDKVEFVKGKGWWVEGYLIKGYAPADNLYELAKALQPTGRRLGFSVEGKVTKRDNNKIVKAKISHVAITHVPVNPECTLDLLTKSMCSHAGEDVCSHCSTCKSLEAGHETVPEKMEGGGALRCQSSTKKLKKLTEEEVKAEIVKKGFPKDKVGTIVGLLKNDVVLSRLISIGGKHHG